MSLLHENQEGRTEKHAMKSLPSGNKLKIKILVCSKETRVETNKINITMLLEIIMTVLTIAIALSPILEMKN